MDDLERKIRKNLKPFLGDWVQVSSLALKDKGREQLYYCASLEYGSENARKTAHIDVIASYHGTVLHVSCNEELVSEGFVRKIMMDDDHLWELSLVLERGFD